MEDKIELNYNGEKIEIPVYTEDQVEKNYNEDLEQTKDLTKELEDLEDTMILEKLNNE